MKTILEITQVNGQWKYRLLRDGAVLVDWQWGPFEREECIRQARSRFIAAREAEVREV